MTREKHNGIAGGERQADSEEDNVQLNELKEVENGGL